MKKKHNLSNPKSAAIGFFFQRTQERVRNSRGKRAISVRAIEVLLYLFRTHSGVPWKKAHSCRFWDF